MREKKMSQKAWEKKSKPKNAKREE